MPLDAEARVGWDFLRRAGASRVREYSAQPLQLDDAALVAEDEGGRVQLDLEMPAAAWQPLTPQTSRTPGLPPFARYIDGKDEGRTIAWLRSTENYPLPLRLAQVGAIGMLAENGRLRRGEHALWRVLCLPGELLPEEALADFTELLRGESIHLLSCRRPAQGWSFEFELMRRAVQERTRDEMVRLEREVLQMSDGPTLIDGRLESRAGAFSPGDRLVLGVIKTHSRNYLHPEGWQAFYQLQPGQRTPAFLIEQKNIAVVSWYVRLAGERGEMPNYGIVRLELAHAYFATALASDFSALDRLSVNLCTLRCRDARYGRHAVSLHPIQRAEESLGAMMSPLEALAAHFYHLTGL